jgi:nitrogen regulatory protein PII
MPNPNQSKKVQDALRKARAKTARSKKRPVQGVGKRKSQTEFFPGVEIARLTNVIEKANSKNKNTAKVLRDIFRKARKGEMVADESSKERTADHQVLFQITRKVNEAEYRNQKVKLTQKESQILNSYKRLL